MKVEIAPSIESGYGHWEPISEDDVPRIKELEKKLLAETKNKQKDLNLSYREGAVLKKGGSVTGYALYTVEKDNRDVGVAIYQVYLTEGARGLPISGLVAKILQEGLARGAEYVAWSSGTERIETLSKAIGANYIDATGWYRLPIDRFNVETFIRRYSGGSQQT